MTAASAVASKEMVARALRATMTAASAPRALALAAVAAALAGSRALAAPGAGTSVAPLVKIGPGARPAGMGGAFVAVADDADASAWNPAGLSLAPSNSVTFMHEQMYQGINYEFLGYAHPIGTGTGVGAHLAYAYTDAIPQTSEDAGGNFDSAHSGGTFRDSDLKFNLSGAGTVMDWVHLGGGVDYLQDKVGSDSADGIMADLGFLLTPVPLFSFGMSLQNVGSRFRGGSRPPSNLRTGAALHLADFLILALEGDHPMDSGHDIYCAGAEAWYQRILALRLGFQLGQSSDAQGRSYSIGFGGRVGAFQVDYAFVPAGDLGDTHRFGVTYAFGGEREEVRRFAGFESGGPARPAGALSAAAAPAVGAGAAPPEPAATSGEIEGHFDRAEELIMAKRYDEAGVELRLASLQLGSHDRRRVRYDEQTGRIALAQGDEPAAADSYMKALKLAQETGLSDASVADSFGGMGLCLLREGNAPYAAKFFEHSLAAGPSPNVRKLVEAALARLRGPSPAAPAGEMRQGPR